MIKNRTGKKHSGLRLGVALILLWAFSWCARGAQMEVIPLRSRILKHNPLHDPDLRETPVFLPAQATNGIRLPVIYYLPGFGNSAARFITGSNTWLKLTQEIADQITPVVFVVVDGKTRWGGSQYLNSPAQGNYADYVCNEIVASVESRHPVPSNGIRRIIAGHSSGGFGALRLGMARQQLFDAVVALSPDSDFNLSHLPLVKLAGVTNVAADQIGQFCSGRLPAPANGDLTYALALSAAYAPRGFLHHGSFEWLYGSRGDFRERVWRRWLENDPLTIARTNPRAFGRGQLVYLDGAANDAYKANIGARKIAQALQTNSFRTTFYEPPGRHSDHMRERIERGVAWVFGRALTDIP